MNEEALNVSMRKFLKKVGIASQREIEKAIRAALADGKLKGHETIPAKVVLTVGAVGLIDRDRRRDRVGVSAQNNEFFGGTRRVLTRPLGLGPF